MLNLEIGLAREIEGRSCIATGTMPGHAVYGPYATLDAGRYLVSFRLAPATAAQSRTDRLVAVLDVVTGNGNVVLASRRVFGSQFEDGRDRFVLDFTMPQRAQVEYRVWVSGATELLIDEYRRVTPFAEGTDEASTLDADAFPAAGEAAPAFFREQEAMFRDLYQQGMRIAFRDGDVVLTVQGVSLYTRVPDDLNFLGEIFHNHAYNLKADRPLTIIDVGMNIGLTSLMLATKPEVEEVHAFEPFPNTYDRAVANLRLNSALAAKISAHNFGLSDRNLDDTITVSTSGDSGSQSTIEVANGQPVHLVLRDAAETLRPILERARAAGRAVVVKLDCEGSEFPIMASLAKAGLVGHIDGFMVEWHSMFPDRAQDVLLAPLREAGFLVFDQSPPTGNGFFYAVRMAAAAG